jgi:stage IV sporulation protein FB
MQFRDGFLVLGHVWRAPIRVHWTTPLVAFALTGLSFVPGAWLGFLVLVLVHEIGHATAARAFGAQVVSVNAHGLGGTCEWYGDVTSKQRAIIAWGGVLAQAALYIGARFASIVVPSWGFFGQLMYTLTATNLILIVINLLPIRPLDGAEAWKILRR